MKISHSGEYSPHLDLSGLCRLAWSSAERMSWALADVGLDYSISSCKRVRSGESEPSFSMGYAIVALAEATIENEIEQRQAKLERHRQRRAHFG